MKLLAALALSALGSAAGLERFEDAFAGGDRDARPII